MCHCRKGFWQAKSIESAKLTGKFEPILVGIYERRDGSTKLSDSKDREHNLEELYQMALENAGEMGTFDFDTQIMCCTEM